MLYLLLFILYQVNLADGTSSYIGYRTAASAASIAIDRLRRDHILDGYEFKITILFDQCDEITAAGRAMELLVVHQVDVIIGPTSNAAAFPVFFLVSYYDIPLVTWGMSSSAELDVITRFPTAAILSVGSKNLATAWRELMKLYGWDQFVFVYSLAVNAEKCKTMRDDFQTMVAKFGDVQMAYAVQVMDTSDAGLSKVQNDVATRGRIIVICFYEGNTLGFHRRWMIMAKRNGYVNDEYVYVFPSLCSNGYTTVKHDGTVVYPWVGPDGPQPEDEEAIPGFQRSFFLVDMFGQGHAPSNYSIFENEVIQRMREPPYNCTAACAGPEFQKAASYAGQLHDSVYVWGHTISRMVSEDPKSYRNGTRFLRSTFENYTGIAGPLVINDEGVLNPTIYLLSLDANNTQQILASILVKPTEGVIDKRYDNEVTGVWAIRGGVRPLDEPKCGFTGSFCPPNVFKLYLGWFIAAIVVIVITIFGAIMALVFMLRAKQQEVERQNSLWQIPFLSLKPVPRKNRGDQSVHSFMSDPGTVSTTGRSVISSEEVEKRHYSFFMLQNEFEVEKIAARKYTTRPFFDHRVCASMRFLRMIDHENLNKFIGMSLDAPQLLSIWRYCSRHSLADVIKKASIQMDGFFIYSLMKDIVNGLTWLHTSTLHHHGMLTSKSCLLNDRWQLKLTEFGLNSFRTHDQLIKMDLLWTAPELLRNDDLDGSQEGDVYSLGIISGELITRKSVFDIENCKEDPEELIYMLKKGGMKAPRPILDADDSMEINPALLHLVRDCWTERPSERPTISQVMSQLKSMNTNRNDNLMDHVFNVLESYASTLEDEVSERMKELVDEKKKSDVLLYRMLPRQVADKLKLGQTVEPETFDCITLFFSDVVGFTTLAGKCTPLQVVNLLNDLYTTFDSIIDQHDVYKVETIGDGYLVCSGLPHRNGREHTRHIASMSLGFRNSLTNFRIPHLPSERINIRIGFHCGSVVAGVVGLTMPRYCLFGDAVNTASRMESNSKPGQIHISEEANKMLMDLGGFGTEKRGEVIVKGKGIMTTYWLLTMDPAAAPKMKKKVE